MTTSACYNLQLCLNLFYIVALFVYSVVWVATTLLNAQVHMSWEAVHNLQKYFIWYVDDFVSYGLFECI